MLKKAAYLCGLMVIVCGMFARAERRSVDLTSIMPRQDILRVKRGAIGEDYRRISAQGIPMNTLMIEGQLNIGTSNNSKNIPIDVRVSTTSAAGIRIRNVNNSSNAMLTAVNDDWQSIAIGKFGSSQDTDYEIKRRDGYILNHGGFFRIVQLNSAGESISAFSINDEGNVGVGTVNYWDADFTVAVERGEEAEFRIGTDYKTSGRDAILRKHTADNSEYSLDIIAGGHPEHGNAMTRFFRGDSQKSQNYPADEFETMRITTDGDLIAHGQLKVNKGAQADWLRAGPTYEDLPDSGRGLELGYRDITNPYSFIYSEDRDNDFSKPIIIGRQGSKIGVGGIYPLSTLDVKGRIRAMESDDGVPTQGKGIEISYHENEDLGLIQSIERHSSANFSMQDLFIGASNLGIGTNPKANSLLTLKMSGDGQGPGIPHWTGVGTGINYTHELRIVHDNAWGNRGVVFRRNVLASSKKIKENIRPYSDDYNKILDLELKAFNYRKEHTPPGMSPQEDFGYIAEDVAKLGLDNLNTYDGKGTVDGIRFDKIPFYILEVVKSQQDLIEKQGSQIRVLKEEMSRVKAQLD